MQYLLLIYEDETNFPKRSEEEVGEIFAGYKKFNELLGKRMIGGDALHPTSTATTVRVREGKTLMTDGPFAETKEQLGGYYLIEAESLDEATELASKIPTAQTGSIEVRPIAILDM